MGYDWTNLDGIGAPGTTKVYHNVISEVDDNVDVMWDEYFNQEVTHYQFSLPGAGSHIQSSKISDARSTIDDYRSENFCHTQKGYFGTCPAHLGTQKANHYSDNKDSHNADDNTGRMHSYFESWYEYRQTNYG